MERLRPVVKEVSDFSRRLSGITLRSYQRGVAEAIADSVIKRLGLSFVVMFPRQSGKNELQAQIETYLLALLSQVDAEIVKVSPTWKPQSLNAMRRLERVLERNLITRALWKRESGYIYKVGKARIFFLSGAPEANIVGATASTLLEVDEAQDVQLAKFDKDIAPMAASTNATKVFWGTAWTSQTLLARELRAAQRLEAQDGRRRTFVLTADDVGREVPPYKAFAAEQVAKLGRSHPMVKTQFYSEEIDGSGGMFPAERVTLMTANHTCTSSPVANKIYAMLLDVAGEDEGLTTLGELSNPGRDSTALTIVEVDLVTVADLVLKAPTYRVVNRRLWTGLKQTKLYGEIKALAELWQVRYLVVDATGVGAGLASFLDKALPGRVIPFVFTGSSKSQLGWDFLGVIDSGRWKEYTEGATDGHPGSAAALQQLFYRQLQLCQYEIIPGPEKRMRWGTPEGCRDTQTGEPIHDDLVLSAALCGALEAQEWTAAGPALVIHARDPIAEMDARKW